MQTSGTCTLQATLVFLKRRIAGMNRKPSCKAVNRNEIVVQYNAQYGEQHIELHATHALHVAMM